MMSRFGEKKSTNLQITNKIGPRNVQYVHPAFLPRNLKRGGGLGLKKIAAMLREIYAQGGSKDRRETTPISGGASGILTDKGTLLPSKRFTKTGRPAFYANIRLTVDAVEQRFTAITLQRTMKYAQGSPASCNYKDNRARFQRENHRKSRSMSSRIESSRAESGARNRDESDRKYTLDTLETETEIVSLPHI